MKIPTPKIPNPKTQTAFNPNYKAKIGKAFWGFADFLSFYACLTTPQKARFPMPDKYFTNIELDGNFTEEADAFSKKFSQKFSELMVRAIRDARAGKTGMLNIIRSQRSAMPSDIAPVEFRDFFIEGKAGKIRARLHVPPEMPSAEASSPLLIYAHGGGWTIGSIESCESACSQIAKKSSCLVLSFDYRLAPENPHPAAQEDAESVFLWAASNPEFNPEKIFFGGDSAGGHIAINLALSLAERGIDKFLRGLVLYYPVTDFCSCENFDSWKKYASGLPLDSETMAEFHNAYIPNLSDRKKFSPLYSDSLETLPPILLLTSERDILRDPAELFAEKVRKSGGKVRRVRMLGAAHIYMTMPAMRKAFNAGVEEACAFIRQIA